MRSHPHLYEISTWPWLDRLSRRLDRYTTLGNVPSEEWDRFQAAGFDFVYLMGVWRRSAIGRLIARTDSSLLQAYDDALPGWSMSDVPGSPYSIQAYEPDERMGGWRGIDTAQRELSERGVKLMLDFVPNHTGLDHPWVTTHPEFYVEGTLDNFRHAPELFHPVEVGDHVHFIACGRDPYFPPWRDLAQLNYFNPATREAVIGALEEIAHHCDAVRCDMAMLVTNEIFSRTWKSTVDLLWSPPNEEFWPTAIARVCSLTYLAEVYWDREWELQQQGFHYTYDKRLLDRLAYSSAADVRAHLRGDPDYAARLVRFLENHDERRSALVFSNRLQAAAATAYTLPGMRFFFDGQLEGAEIKTPVQLGRWFVEPVRPPVRDLYDRLLRASDLTLFHEGVWRPLECRSTGDATSSDLVAFSWHTDRELAIVVTNLGKVESQGLVRFTVPAGDAFDFCDQLTDQKYRWAADDLTEGLYVRLPHGAAHVFLVERVGATSEDGTSSDLRRQ